MMTSKAAKRYAKAFYDIATEKGSLDQVKTDLDGLAELISASAELQDFLKAPLISTAKRTEVLKALFEGKISNLALEFILFLLRKERLEILADVCAVFAELYNEQNNIQNITITSAFAMDDDQVEAIKKQINSKIDKTIIAETLVDSDLIGGFKVQVGDTVHDLSVKTQLETLKKTIVNA